MDNPAFYMCKWPSLSIQLLAVVQWRPMIRLPEQLSACQLYPLQETLAPIQETIVSVKAQNYSHQVIPTVTMCVD